MSAIDFFARIVGDGPWSKGQAVRNARNSAERTGERYEVVEVEPGRWVSRRMRSSATCITEREDGSIVVSPTVGKELP